MRGEGEEFIGFGERGGEGFFRVNVRTGLEGGQAHRVVLVAVARGETDELRFFFFEKFTVVGVVARRLRAGCGLGATGGIGIGDSDDLEVGAIVEGHVHAVSVVAATRVAEDGGAEFRALGSGAATERLGLATMVIQPAVAARNSRREGGEAGHWGVMRKSGFGNGATMRVGKARGQSKLGAAPNWSGGGGRSRGWKLQLGGTDPSACGSPRSCGE